MRAAARLFAAVAACALFAVTVAAQAPRHEFGVDLGISSIKSDGDDGRTLFIGTPIDVRIGFVSAGAFSLEPRFAFTFTDDDDSSFLIFTPGLNGLYRLGPGSGLHNQMGAYLTGGLDLLWIRDSFEGDSESQSQFGFNLGIGTRRQWGNAAFRPEVFFAYGFESGDETDFDGFIPSSTSFGLRLGISLWR